MSILLTTIMDLKRIYDILEIQKTRVNQTRSKPVDYKTIVYNNKTISKDNIKELLEENNILDPAGNVVDSFDRENTVVFIIRESDVNPKIKHLSINNFWKPHRIHLIIIEYKRLMYDVVNHELQPKFVKVWNYTDYNEQYEKQTRGEDDPNARPVDAQGFGPIDNHRIFYNPQELQQRSMYDPFIIGLFVQPSQIVEVLTPNPTAGYVREYYLIMDRLMRDFGGDDVGDDDAGTSDIKD